MRIMRIGIVIYLQKVIMCRKPICHMVHILLYGQDEIECSRSNHTSITNEQRRQLNRA